MTSNRLLVAGSILAFGLGAVMLLVPGLATFGPGSGFLTVVGLLALWFAARSAMGRRRSERRETQPPPVERRAAVPVPGDEADRLLQRAGTHEGRFGTRAQVRKRVAAVATSVLSTYGAQSPSEARASMEQGTWTDDPEAAALFAPDEAVVARPSWGERLGLALNPGARFQRRVRHAVDELASLVDGGIDPPRDDSPESRSVADVEWDTEHDPGPWSTERWTGVGIVALLGIGLGVLFSRPSVVLASCAGIGYAAYAHSGTAPEPALSIERTVEPPDPDPGDRAVVRTTVRNEGSSALADVRFVDGVPAAIPVVEGSPRAGTALRPGGSTTLSYVIEAYRGRHEFEDARAIVRSIDGSIELTERLPLETTIECRPSDRPVVSSLPLRTLTSRYAGRVSTESGGEGIEFYGVREYRSGDPLSRIDWGRHARTGELATLQFREERAATVVLLVDCRDAAYRTPDPDGPHAVDTGVSAASRLFHRLLDDGNRVGIASMHPDPCLLEPGAGRETRARGRELLASHPSFAPRPSARPFGPDHWERWFLQRLPDDAQVLLMTPLCDDGVALTVRELEAAGHPVTVLSLDPTVLTSTGRVLLALERTVRIASLREVGVPVIDWIPGDTLDVTLARTGERWSP